MQSPSLSAPHQPSRTLATQHPGKSTSAFASSTMMNILQAGLKQLTDSDEQNIPSHIDAHVPLDTKRAFVGRVAQQYGNEALLKLGVGVSEFTQTPTGRALLHRSTPYSLIKKWQRLESYIHSSHYIECEFQGNRCKIQHKSKTEIQPSLQEDLVVMGVICALLHQVTGTQISLSQNADFKKVDVFSYPDLSINQSPQASSHWCIQWQTTATNEKALPFSLDTTPDQPAKNIISQTKQAILEIGLLDCGIKQVASHMALSTRGLQRYLQQAHSKFASLVQQVRTESASQLLLNEGLSFAEVGFVCGFADQAHFSRIFKKWTGMSPKQYAQFKT